MKQFTISHRIDPDTGREGLSVFFDGTLMPPIDSDHPNFQKIKDVCLYAFEQGGQVEDDFDGEHFRAMFDVAAAVNERFQRLTDRVVVQGGTVTIDGDPVGEGITNHILRFLDEGLDSKWMALVMFLENVSANPEPHSRDQLYDWLNTHEFTITDEGYLVGYKGVQSPDENGVRHSITAGKETVFVNDEPFVGHIPNPIGATVEMARGLVEHDPSVGCHIGLHVGTHEYASSFGSGDCLEVKVNPRDVRSVPTDCNWQKIRVCRYQVVGVVESKYTSAIREFDVDGSREDDDAYVDLDLDDFEFAVGDEVIDTRDDDHGVITDRAAGADGIEYEVDFGYITTWVYEEDLRDADE